MNLGDPELELIDPTPNIHALFIQFDKTFFFTKLASRAVVRWSKRMYSCAGVCSYEGRGGLCDVALSEPLLKLRPRKDLVETLLHEMIHAYLFITQRDQDRDGHGPNFKEHMYRINKAAGINISIYHSFHDEVELYQTHWWRCDGPCQFRKPHFGIVRRPMNSAPGPRDYWWADHQRKCGGTFIKIKEPEKKNKKGVVAKPPGDITKYITNTKSTKIPPMGEPKIIQISDINSKSNYSNTKTKSNSSSTVVVTQKTSSSSVNVPAVKSPSVLTGKGYTIASTRVRSNSVDASEAVRNIWAKKQLTPNIFSSTTDDKGKVTATETVRNVWAKKQLTPNTLSPINTNRNPKVKTTNITPNNKRVSTNLNNSNVNQKSSKHKADSNHTEAPPMKVKKIDDYFKTNAASLLKDIYGTNIEVVESNNNKLIALHNTNTSNMQIIKVDCPICRLKIDESVINSHLDECLNKDLIAKMCDTNEGGAPPPQVKTEIVVNKNSVVKKVSKELSNEILNTLPPIPPYKPKSPNNKAGTDTKPDFKDSMNWNDYIKPDLSKIKFEPANIGEHKFVVQTTQFDKNLRNSDNFILPKKEDLQSGNLPFKANDETANKITSVKVEPGTSRESSFVEQKCPCCGSEIAKPIDEHLDECLAFFATDTAPEEASTSLANQTILIDDEDDDIFDESQVFNATGTKLPCPCCLKMVENDDMNAHLDSCLS